MKITGRVNAFQVEVTPAIAERWLTFNQANRSPSKAKIKRFAASMKSGRWVLNGETVKFSVSGRLLDGQSRLMAVILAGVTVLLEVRAGLPDAVQKSMDIGELRKGTHTLEMMGEKYPAVLAPALKLYWLWERDILGGNKFKQTTVMENYDLPPMLEKHVAMKASVGWVMGPGAAIAKLLAPSTAAFFHYSFGVIDEQLRDHFFNALAEGEALTKISPIYHLRERLLDDRLKKVASSQKFVHRALIIKAWNMARRGEKATGLRWASGEEFPAIDGAKLNKAA